MTSPDPTTPQPPPDPPAVPPDPPAPRRLTRSSSDKVLGGVAGGLGRYFDVDPILFRIGLAIAALAGGAGLLGYFALWFLVRDDQGKGMQRPEARNLALVLGGGLLLVVLFGLTPGADFILWPGFLGLLALGVLVAAIISADRDGDTRSRLTRAIIVTLAIVGAGIAGFFAAVGTAFGGGAVVAGIVILLGLGLIAGAFGRGRRWLIVPALVLATPAAIVQAADLRVDGGIGERAYRPASVTDMRDLYRLGAGELTIDLRAVNFPAGRTYTRVDMGVGAVEIIVPDDVCVTSETEVGAGVVSVFDHENEGVDFDWSQRPDTTPRSADLFIDANVDLGAVFIRHASDAGTVLRDDDDRGPFGRDYDGDYGFGPVPQAACG